MKDLRQCFLLPADEIYLNAGTFSALPRAVYEEQIALMASAESNPTRQATARARLPLWGMQQQIARYLGADAEEIIFHQNVTQALNQALFCLPWRAGGEFIASDQEYGAITNAAREMCRRNGLSFREFPLPLQPQNSDELLATVLNALTPETVGVLLSHITSKTGLVLPIDRIGTELRKRNVRFIVDGAHGPGLLPLQLSATDVDVYAGNLHKWFMGSKGTGFLRVARRLHDVMEPHIVGWGGTPRDATPIHDQFPGNAYRFQYVFRMQGLKDVSSFLALGAVLRFRESLGEAWILERISELGRYARRRLEIDLGLKCFSPIPELNAGLLAFEAPPTWRESNATERMYRDYKITVPFWVDRQHGSMLRISPHIWNVEEDVDRLLAALQGG